MGILASLDNLYSSHVILGSETKYTVQELDSCRGYRYTRNQTTWHPDERLRYYIWSELFRRVNQDRAIFFEQRRAMIREHAVNRVHRVLVPTLTLALHKNASLREELAVLQLDLAFQSYYLTQLTEFKQLFAKHNLLWEDPIPWLFQVDHSILMTVDE
jgi:hypothetical protein